MNSLRCTFRALLPALALLLAAGPRLAAQGPLITLQPPAGADLALEYPSSSTNRFVLLTGLSVDAVATPVATNEGRAGLDRFAITLEPDLPARFFRLLVLDSPPAGPTNAPTAALTVSARPGVHFSPGTGQGAAFVAPVDLVLAALAHDPDGTIVRVEFLSGETVLATLTAPPFLFEWNNVPPGAHAVRVRATDNEGLTATSAEWAISVAPNTPPAVALVDPADHSTWPVSARLRLVADATDPNPGGVGRVEFRVNGSRVADVFVPPFAADWTPTLPGQYALTATAYDLNGGVSVSAVRTIRVVPANSLPSVALLAPVAGARFEQLDDGRLEITLSAAASDPDGVVQRVEFFAGGAKIAEAFPPLFTARWTNAPVGQHLLTALAVDDSGATGFSDPVPVEVTGPGGVPTRFAMSPSPGESGVSVNREVILRFHRELSETAVITTDTLFATAAGRRILARVELSGDRRKATLFFLENLPASARVQVTFHGDRVLDRLARPVDGDLDGRPGGTGRFEFETAANAPVAGTAVIGRVLASEYRVAGGATNWVNVPLQGVTITVDGREQDLRAVTDAEGNFTLTNAPAGRFFVHVDGRTAVGSRWPDGAYYPFVGKAWEAAAGVATNLAGGTGEIFLPLIPAGALRPVSPAEVTLVEVDPDRTPIIIIRPRLYVPPNALVDDNGVRGGRVGLALVEPDRLPEPLPPGLNFPLVVTVQTDGPQNFDVPAPLEFPNLPDPVTGRKLNVGDKTALWSFNHDTGQWEVQGSMTIQLVERDGQLVEMAVTDPGVGILQPGWHGTQPGGSGGGGGGDNCPGPCCAGGGDDLAGLVACKFPKIPKCVFKAIQCAARLGCGGYWDCVKELQRCDECGGGSGGRRPQGLELHQDDPRSDLLRRSEEFVRRAHEIMAELEVIETTPMPTPAQLDRQSQLLGQLDALLGGPERTLARQLLAEISASHPRLTGLVPPANPVFYLVTTSSGQQRGRTGPDGRYRVIFGQSDTGILIEFFDPVRWQYGSTYLANPQIGQNYEFPPYALTDLDSPLDGDGDGLPDIAEEILGTNPFLADTDGDGISDGAEVAAGTDPASGLAVRTGVVASAPMPGTALDVCALNNLAVVAGGSAGVSVFNIVAGLTPALIAQVDTPGTAHAVACAPGWIAVADGAAGLALVDLRAPAEAQVAHQLALGAEVRAVAVAGLTAYAGLRNGQVVAVDLPSGAVLQRVTHGQGVQDLAVDGDTLLVALDSLLVRHEIRPDGLRLNATAALSGLPPEGISGRRRVTAGGGLAYVTAYPGFDVFDTADLLVLTRVGNVAEHGPNSFKQIVPNGTGLGVAAVGVNPRNDGTHDVYLYDLSEPAITTRFQNALPTPDVAHALSLYNGLAYVADGAAGLLVVNYLAYDNRGQAPAITLAANLPAGVVEQGGVFRVTARVTDDVQVRAVEFFVDGVRVLTDGNFPFEARLIAPLLDRGAGLPPRTNVVVHAVASDTGGNRTRSADLVLTLADDLTPPAVASVTPAAGTMSPPNSVTAVAVTFTEPVDPASVRLTLAAPGPDGVPGSDDDVPVPGGVLALRPDGQTAVLTFPAALTGQTYRATVAAGYRDAAGNAAPAAFGWTFDARPREVRVTGSLTIAAGDFSRDNGDLVIQPGATLTIAGAHRFNSVTVAAGGTVTAPAGVRLDLAVAGDVVVAADAVINLTAKGHPGAQFGHPGPGGGQTGRYSGGGGSHGGAGGRSSEDYVGGATYGSVFEPAELGSGGGDRWENDGHWPGAGGGALRLSVGGTLTVDGVVQADGSDANYGSGGGSGGSVWLSAARLAGTGVIRANGGRDPSGAGGGGGGGGRVAVHVGEQSFSGTLQACGGGGSEQGGAGTVYLKVGDVLGTVTVDNCGQAGASTELGGSHAWEAHLVVARGGRVGPRWRQAGFHLQVSGDVMVAAGGEFTASGRGHPGAQFGHPGPGGGQTGRYSGGGGSHGGAGGRSSEDYVGGATYGSVFEPAELGSGGGDRWENDGHWPGAGGGALRLSVGGTLTVDGVVQADGSDANYGSGGGSGGSVWLSAARLAGTGVIRANGGRDPSGAGGGGGGGGRVAIFYDVLDDTVRDAVQARGGDGHQQGGSGTVWLQRRSDSLGELVIVSPFLSKSTASTEMSGDVWVPGRMRIRSGAAVTHPHGRPLNLTVLGDFTIASGARLTANGRGYSGVTGPGASDAGWSGAGHGGRGGNATGAGGRQGGPVYGDPDQPVDLGSGGNRNAWGGGALRLNVLGVLSVQGELTSDGLADDYAGGAGGSLYVRAGRLAGSGTISAAGGRSPRGDAGAGGGGRIALYYHGGAFDTNRVSVAAGNGGGVGQPGSLVHVVRGLGDAPAVVAAHGSPSLTEVAVVFDHLLDWATSQEAGRYALSGGLAVLEAELQHDLRTVILRTTPQIAGTAYTVTVDGVKNGLGVAAAAGASAGFTAATVARGAVREEVFYGVPGHRLGELYADAKWPAAPDLVNLVPRLQADTDDVDGDQLGARLTGYLIPAVSGWHTFYFASDDNGALYLGQDHTRDNLRLIASEPLRSRRGDWATSDVADIRNARAYPPANISAPVWLEAGRWYWLDARMKEGTGAEHLGVTWQAPGEEPPPPGQATRLSGQLIAPPVP